MSTKCQRGSKFEIEIPNIPLFEFLVKFSEAFNYIPRKAVSFCPKEALRGAQAVELEGVGFAALDELRL